MINDDGMWRHVDSNPTRTPEKQKKFNKKGALATGGLALAAVLAIGTTAVVSHHGGNDTQQVQAGGTSAPGVLESLAQQNSGASESEAPTPLTLDPWQTVKWSGATEKDITSAQKTWAAEQAKTGMAGVRSTSTLTPESAGFTSDPTKATVNGAPNPLYSYWTSDLFNQESALEVQAFINPAFGGWGSAQAPKANPASQLNASTFAGIFTESFVKSTKGKNPSAYLPILADWKGNGYGGAGVVEQTGGAYWIGEVTSSTAKWKYDDQALGYTVDATYNVKFTGVRADGSTATKNGVLKLKFVPAPLAVAEAGGYRVQVDAASLEVK